jgi:ABC-type multidrug transport system fused ATPase/permease subunit
MQNLNQLLLEAPDVVDAPRAVALPPASSAVHAKGKCRLIYIIRVCMYIDAMLIRIFGNKSTGLAVRFDDVSFNYPEQRPEGGLKHVAFEIRPGTTTALVGSTGQ